jgi:glutamate dehydrogenase
VKAYVKARDVFGLHQWWSAVEGLDHAVDARVQLQVFADLQRLLRLATRWFLHNRRANLDLGAEVAALAAPVRTYPGGDGRVRTWRAAARMAQAS